MMEGFHGFSQPFEANAKTVHRLGHKYFLQSPFQFIVTHPLSYHLRLYILDTESTVMKKCTTSGTLFVPCSPIPFQGLLSPPT
jgi:hypothetical protein